MNNSYFLQFHANAMALCQHKINAVATAWQNSSFCGHLSNAMAYSLQAGGKRLRPTMAYASASLLCNDGNLAQNNNFIKTLAQPDATKNMFGNLEKLSPTSHQFALAIEMLHTYSLIHDDLPAMDNDTLRRGKPTCHVKFGEDMAILAGDALQSEALSILLGSFSAGKQINTSITPIALLQSASYFCQCAGMHGMVGGQAIDVMQTAANEQDVQVMHQLKTGKLISAALICPLLMFGKNQLVEPLKNYAKAIGLLYQVTDDILDQTKESSTLGKNAGSDARNNKITFISLFGLQGSRRKATEYLQQSQLALGEVAEKMLESKECGSSTKNKQPTKENVTLRLQFFYQLANYIFSRSY